MSEHTPENNENAGVPLFDPATLRPDDVPAPEPAPVPDHTASADEPTSLVERVKARAKREQQERDAGRSETRSKARKAPRKAVPKTRAGALVEPLTGIYTSVGLMLAMVDPVCSTAILENAEACAKSVDALAQQNDAVRRAVLALTQTSAWGGVMIAHMPILLMLTVHHGPKDVADRAAPLAMMMNPRAATDAANANPDTGEDVPRAV